MRCILTKIFLLISLFSFGQRGGSSGNGRLSGPTKWYLKQCATKPTGYNIGKIDSVLKSLIGQNQYQYIDLLYDWAQDRQANALIPIKVPVALNNNNWFTTAVNVNSVTFTSNVGFQGDSATSYISTGYVPSLTAVNYTLNSAFIGLYSKTPGKSLNTDMGGTDASNTDFTQLYCYYTDGNQYIRVNNGTGLNSATATTGSGFHTAVRISSTQVQAWYNGSNLGTSNLASTALTGHTIFVLCVNVNGTPLQFSGRKVSSVIIGGGGADQGKLNSILQNLR